MDNKTIKRSFSRDEIYQREKLQVNNNFWQKWVVPYIRRVKENKCKKCNSKGRLDIHHTDYDNVNVHTLILLCRKCHKKSH